MFSNNHLGIGIAGIGMTEFKDHSKLVKKPTLVELLMEAIGQAIDDANIKPSKISKIIVGSMDPENFGGEGHINGKVQDEFSKKYKKIIPSIMVSDASATGAAAITTGIESLICRSTNLKLNEGKFSGTYAKKERERYILVVGGDMVGLGTDEATSKTSLILTPNYLRQHKTMLRLAHEITDKIKKKNGLTNEDLDLLSKIFHRNGSYNPRAQFKGTKFRDNSFDERLADDKKNPPVGGTTYRRLWATSFSDGAAAILLTDKRCEQEIIGYGSGGDYLELEARKNPNRFMATYDAAKAAFNMTDINPENIDAAELHDAFLAFTIIGAVEIGLYRTIEDSLEGLRAGEFELDGRLPINPSGGLKAKGHPYGASGISQVDELVIQMRRRAEGFQIQKPIKYALTHSIGNLAVSNYVIILRNNAT